MILNSKMNKYKITKKFPKTLAISEKNGYNI